MGSYGQGWDKADKNSPQAACPGLHLGMLFHHAQSPFSLQLSTSGLGGKKRSVVSGLKALISQLKRRKDGECTGSAL